LPKDEILRLLEAARWSPSASNQQPWHFVVCARDTPAFDAVHNTLAAGNKPWTSRAAALIVVVTDTVRTSKDGTRSPRRLAAYDAGAAWMALALQGTQQGVVVHCMEGFDHVACKGVIKAPEHIDVLTVVAVGLPGDPADLSEAWQREAEGNPSGRRPLTEIVSFGTFG
jgi:nitroreductase